MDFHKNVNSLSDEGLMKINGGIIYPREMPENLFPDGTVCVRYVTETEVGPRVRLTEEYLKEPEARLTGKYRLQYVVVSDNP